MVGDPDREATGSSAGRESESTDHATEIRYPEILYGMRRTSRLVVTLGKGGTVEN